MIIVLQTTEMVSTTEEKQELKAQKRKIRKRGKIQAQQQTVKKRGGHCKGNTGSQINKNLYRIAQLRRAQKWLNKVHTTTVRIQLQQLYIYFRETFVPSLKLQQNSNFLKRRKLAQ